MAGTSGDGFQPGSQRHAAPNRALPAEVPDAATLPPATLPREVPFADRLTLPPARPPSGDTAPARPEVPGYEILGELGRGGMGVVYRARQLNLNRVVALKMILAGGHAADAELARFRSEAEAVARLQHPNIVQIHEVGEHAGLSFFSLEYVPGGSLADRLDGTPWPPEPAARLAATLARAMHAAHQAGVVHRDLKPANVLLGKDAEPKVTDFGLAKRLDDAAGPTRTGAIMGTPSYMAPEQAGGKSKEAGPPCDVYALGAILYELLTGRPPFRAPTDLDTVLQVLSTEPVPPRLLNPKVSRDLETVCLKCLEKDPARRYASAGALAGDLEQYLAGGSIAARSVNVLDRLARTLERSTDETEFLNWGNLALWAGTAIVLCQSGAFVVARLGLPYGFAVVPQWVQFALIAVAFWRHRPGRLLPGTRAERQLWAIWIAYFLSVAVTAAIRLQESAGQPIWGGPLYPYSAMLTGVAFFVMGSTFWGGCYLVGLGFFALAAAMPSHLTWAPLEFAMLWGVTLFTVGVRLRRLAREQHRLTSG
jgi:serine/threonine-protein kinase